MSIIHIYFVYLLKEVKDIHFPQGSLGIMEESGKQQCQAGNGVVTAVTEGPEVAWSPEDEHLTQTHYQEKIHGGDSIGTEFYEIHVELREEARVASSTEVLPGTCSGMRENLESEF